MSPVLRTRAAVGVVFLLSFAVLLVGVGSDVAGVPLLIGGMQTKHLYAFGIIGCMVCTVVATCSFRVGGRGGAGAMTTTVLLRLSAMLLALIVVPLCLLWASDEWAHPLTMPDGCPSVWVAEGTFALSDGQASFYAPRGMLRGEAIDTSHTKTPDAFAEGRYTASLGTDGVFVRAPDAGPVWLPLHCD